VIDNVGSGSSLTVSSLAAPARTFDVSSVPLEKGQTVAALNRIAGEAMATVAAELMRLTETRLADAGTVTVSSWAGRPARGDDFVLTLTAPAASDKTVADLVRFGTIHGPPEYGHISPMRGLVAGEDVTRIETARGDDWFSLKGEDEGAAPQASLPESIAVFGGDGGDWIDVFASGAVTLDGGAGDDHIVLTSASEDVAGVSMLRGGSGEDRLWTNRSPTRQ
jgi:hypothetical protein